MVSKWKLKKWKGKLQLNVQLNLLGNTFCLTADKSCFSSRNSVGDYTRGFTADDLEKRVAAIISSTILFTYRKNFIPLLYDLDIRRLSIISKEHLNLISDSGWGCMVRAG